MTNKSKWATIAGLVGLAVYQATNSDYAGAVQSLMGVGVLLGWLADSKVQAERLQMVERRMGMV